MACCIPCGVLCQSVRVAPLNNSPTTRNIKYLPASCVGISEIRARFFRPGVLNCESGDCKEPSERTNASTVINETFDATERLISPSASSLK